MLLRIRPWRLSLRYNSIARKLADHLGTSLNPSSGSNVLGRARVTHGTGSNPYFTLGSQNGSYKLPANILPKNYIQEEPSHDDPIIIAMSSGVDSSVAAAIYAKKYPHGNVRAIFMANWSQTAKCTEDDWNEVQRVCSQLKIPSERVNFEREYWNDVFAPMIRDYEKGNTPNPDTSCNKFVKFGRLVEYLEEKFAGKKWWLVTGHYARVMKQDSKNYLLRAYSRNKDQSYYLSSVPETALKHILMPIGHYHKPQVREMANEFGLPNAQKPDSQGLCFVSQEHTNFREFLNEYITPQPGNIVTEDGKIWGRHEGLWHCTIGQKSTILMPQGDPNYKGVWFVSEKNVEKNELVIVRGRDNPNLYKSNLRVCLFEWMQNDDKNLKNLQMQYRSLQKPIQVKNISNGGSEFTLELETAARAMAPGQNVVLYQGSRVLGSGIVEEAF